MAASDWTTLINAAALAVALVRDDLIVLDCRFQLTAPDAGEAAWWQSRLPGACYVHLDHDLSDHRIQGQGRHPWPSAGLFAAVLARLGVTPAHQIVVYDDGDGAFAARVWWMLRLFGHQAVAVLDGGWSGWQEQGRAIEHHPPVTPCPVPVNRAARFDHTRLVDAEGVRAHLNAGGLLLDARAAGRFRGEVEPIDPVGGHIPGARNRPHSSNLAGGHFRPREVLRREFAALLDGRPAAALVAMCGSGVSACHHLLAMAYAGLDGARLYPGSWSGWIADPARPIATGT